MQDERPDVDEVAGGKGEKAGAVDELKVLESPDLVPDRLFHDIDDVERRGCSKKDSFQRLPLCAKHEVRCGSTVRIQERLTERQEAHDQNKSLPIRSPLRSLEPSQCRSPLKAMEASRCASANASASSFSATSSSHFPSSGHRCLMLCRIFSRSSEWYQRSIRIVLVRNATVRL